MAKKKKKGSIKSDQEAVEKPAAVEKAGAPKAAAKAPAPKPKPKTAEDKRKAYVDGIKKTLYPSVLGVIAGFACYFALGIGHPEIPWHAVMLAVVTLTYYIQKLTYPMLEVNSAEFGLKDWFYVEFMAIDLWLVTWTLLLN